MSLFNEFHFFFLFLVLMSRIHVLLYAAEVN